MNTAAAAGLGDYVYTDTPGKSKTMHFNNAGSSLMPKVVLDAQVGYLNLEATIGGYEAVIQCQEELDAVYTSVARLVGADSPEEIALTESATVGWAQAFYSIPFQPGDRILCVEQEYISNYLAYLQIAKEKGVIIEIIPIDSVGDVCLASLDRMLKEGRVKVVSITHIPTNSGLVHDVMAIGAVVKAADADIIYFVDACQSAGQIPLDVNDIKCDMLSATSRKYLRGPRGAGFVYVRKATMNKFDLHPPVIDLRGATWKSDSEYSLSATARRFEFWESNYAAQMGLGAACDYALEIGLEEIEARVTELADKLRARLSETSEAIVIHRVGRKQCGIVSFSIRGLEAREVVRELRERFKINTSVSGPRSTLLDSRRQVDSHRGELIRASVHYYNDEAEIEKFIGAIDEIQNESDPK